jgi:hypothetical protein
VQTIRDVIIAELKRQKKYNKQMYKAITSFFGDDVFESPPIDTLVNDGSLVDIIDTFLPVVISALGISSSELTYIKSFITSVLAQEDGKGLFIKLPKNTLTVKGKQRLVDLLYENEKFRT